MSRSQWAAGGLVLVLAALGCGRSEEAQLEALGKRVDAQRDVVDAAREVVDDRVLAVQASEDELAAAREALREAERELAALQREAGSAATDPVLFRLVQLRLLDDTALEDVAIAAAVQGGVVTLNGEVPSTSLRERAARIARSVPGVVSVENRIRITAPVAAPPRAED